MTEKKDTPPVNNSIQTRLSGVMLMVLVFALGINFFIFSQIQNAVTRIDAVFSSNVDVNELSEALELVENTVYEYLNTKSTFCKQSCKFICSAIMSGQNRDNKLSRLVHHQNRDVCKSWAAVSMRSPRR